MTTLSAQTLYDKYKPQLKDTLDRIKKDHERSIPFIISKITTQIVPQMMSDTGKVKGLTGQQKKSMIIDSVNLAIDEVFQEFNIPDQTWDEDLKMLLLTITDPTIDTLIQVENGELVFNKEIKSGLKKLFTCKCLRKQD